MMKNLNWALAAVAALVSAGCAAPTLQAQWHDPSLPQAYLRGAKVLVACEAGELVLKQICEDQLSAGLTQRGAVPVRATGGADAASARAAGAKAALSVGVTVAVQSVSSGVQIGIGIGGFGGGYGGGAGGGVGVSAPVGGGRVSNGYTANARIGDAVGERLMWTAQAGTPPSSDLNAQMAELARALLDAAAQAGMF